MVSSVATCKNRNESDAIHSSSVVKSRPDDANTTVVSIVEDDEDITTEISNESMSNTIMLDDTYATFATATATTTTTTTSTSTASIMGDEDDIRSTSHLYRDEDQSNGSISSSNNAINRSVDNSDEPHPGPTTNHIIADDTSSESVSSEEEEGEEECEASKLLTRLRNNNDTTLEKLDLQCWELFDYLLRNLKDFEACTSINSTVRSIRVARPSWDYSIRMGDRFLDTTTANTTTTNRMIGVDGTEYDEEVVEQQYFEHCCSSIGPALGLFQQLIKLDFECGHATDYVAMALILKHVRQIQALRVWIWTDDHEPPECVDHALAHHPSIEELVIYSRPVRTTSYTTTPQPHDDSANDTAVADTTLGMRTPDTEEEEDTSTSSNTSALINPFPTSIDTLPKLKRLTFLCICDDTSSRLPQLEKFHLQRQSSKQPQILKSSLQQRQTHLTTLTELVLSRVSLDGLADTIANISQLRVLKVQLCKTSSSSSNFLDKIITRKIKKGCIGNDVTGLEHLELSCPNDLHLYTSLARAIRHNDATFTKLEIGYMRDDLWINDIAPSLCTNTKIEHLSIAGNITSNGFLHGLSKLVHRNRTLKNLSIFHPAGMGILADIFLGCMSALTNINATSKDSSSSVAGSCNNSSSIRRLEVRGPNQMIPILSVQQAIAVTLLLRDKNFTLIDCPFDVVEDHSISSYMTKPSRESHNGGTRNQGHRHTSNTHLLDENSTTRAMSKIALNHPIVNFARTLCILNEANRGSTIRDANATRNDIMELIILARNDLDALWSLILLKPALMCCSSQTAYM